MAASRAQPLLPLQPPRPPSPIAATPGRGSEGGKDTAAGLPAGAIAGMAVAAGLLALLAAAALVLARRRRRNPNRVNSAGAPPEASIGSAWPSPEAPTARMSAAGDTSPVSVRSPAPSPRATASGSEHPDTSATAAAAAIPEIGDEPEQRATPFGRRATGAFAALSALRPTHKHHSSRVLPVASLAGPCAAPTSQGRGRWASESGAPPPAGLHQLETRARSSAPGTEPWAPVMPASGNHHHASKRTWRLPMQHASSQGSLPGDLEESVLPNPEPAAIAAAYALPGAAPAARARPRSATESGLAATPQAFQQPEERSGLAAVMVSGGGRSLVSDSGDERAAGPLTTTARTASAAHSLAPAGAAGPVGAAPLAALPNLVLEHYELLALGQAGGYESSPSSRPESTGVSRYGGLRPTPRPSCTGASASAGGSRRASASGLGASRSSRNSLAGDALGLPLPPQSVMAVASMMVVATDLAVPPRRHGRVSAPGQLAAPERCAEEASLERQEVEAAEAEEPGPMVALPTPRTLRRTASSMRRMEAVREERGDV